MDIRSIIAPTVTDLNALEEFIESLHDLAPSIEKDVPSEKRSGRQGYPWQPVSFHAQHQGRCDTVPR